jgi:hypothetical protein
MSAPNLKLVRPSDATTEKLFGRLPPVPKPPTTEQEGRASDSPAYLAQIKSETKSDIFHSIWLARACLITLFLTFLWHGGKYAVTRIEKWFGGEEVLAATRGLDDIELENDRNVYAGPGDDSELLGVYERGSRLRLTGEDVVTDGTLWHKVETVGGSRKGKAPTQGWVKAF